MREIKFRGKRTDNGEWVEGYLTRRPSAIQYEAHYSPWFIDVPPQDPDDSGGLYNVDRETVGEFTGLTDKNGTEIFEGDIVRIDGKNYEVQYLLGQFFVGINMPIAYKRFECEAIGNVHDNPELLEREAEK